jgi:hypothetical protein
MKRLVARRRRVFALAAVAAAAIGVAAGYGYTAITATNQAYTGCLLNGSILNVAIGNAPSKACQNNAVQISWSQTGPTGVTGSTGPTGATGPQGLPGNNGTNGADGATGATGLRGLPGINGTDGATGPKGDTGPAGATGPGGVTGYESVSASTDIGPQSSAVAVAHCPAGKTPLSGEWGATITGGLYDGQHFVDMLYVSSFGINTDRTSSRSTTSARPTPSGWA